MSHSYYFTITLIFAMLFAVAQTAEAQQRSAVQVDAAVQSASVLNQANILRNYDPEGAISLQIVNPDVGEGFVFGTNVYGDQAKATFFEVDSLIAIESVNLFFGGGTGIGTITVRVVAGSEESGPDLSQVFGSVEFDLSDANIPDDPENIEATNIQFDVPVTVSGQFGIVYSWDPEELEDGAFGLASGVEQEMRIATEWEQWDNNSWNNVSDAWTGQYDDGELIPGSGVLGWYQWIDVILTDAPDLGEFSLLTPPNGAEVDVMIDGEDSVVIEWEASANAESYLWVANLPGAGFEEPLIGLNSDSDGSANTLSLTTGNLYDVLVDAGAVPGNSLTVEWTVFASAGSSSLQAEEVWEVTFNIMEPPVSTEPIETVNGFALEQNYPNPFNPTTNISFTLPEASDVSLEVFNMQGQRVAAIAGGTMAAGSHNVSFDAANLSSGIYLYRLTAGAFTATNKMMLVK